MQEYVDDPTIIAAGSREQRLRLLTVVLLFWAALRFDLCWKKGQKGPTVEWMGGELCLLQEEVAVQLTGARTQAAKYNINELLHGQDILPVKKLVFFSLDTCRGLRQWRQWPDHVSRCFGRHSQIIPSGHRRETRRESGPRSWFLSNALLTQSDGFVLCCLDWVHFGELSL